MIEPELEIPLDEEQPILVGGETAEEATLTKNIYAEIRCRLAARGIPVICVFCHHRLGDFLLNLR